MLCKCWSASAQPASIPSISKIRKGQYPAVQEDRLPYTLGRDVSGIVEKCGAQSKRFNIGDEVVGMVGIGGGGYAAVREGEGSPGDDDGLDRPG